MDLNNQLRAERVRLDRLITTGQAITDEVAGLEQQVEEFTLASARDAEDVLLLEAKANPALTKKLATARAELAAAQDRQAAYQRALQRQHETIAGIESAIASSRRAALMKALETPRAQFLAAAESFVEAAVKVAVVLDEHFAGARYDLVLPPADPRDPLARFTERQGLAELLHAAVSLHAERIHRGLRKVG